MILKKYKALFITIIFTLILFVFPSNVNATSYKSGLNNLKEDIILKTDEFEIALNYTNLNSETIDRSAMITGITTRKQSESYYFHYIIYYYDRNEQEIGASDGYNSILRDEDDATSSSFDNYLELKDMYNSYELEDIVYYRIYIEPANKEIIENALYNNSQYDKSGIDELSDSNTIDMTVGTKDDLNSIYGNNNIQTNTIGNGEYAITNYHIDMVVNENNTFDMNEKITTYFNVPKHGIYRSLPLKNNVTRLDGTTSSNRAEVTNINVNHDYKTYKENNNLIIKVGDSSSTLSGEQSYIIKYNYNIGKDSGEDYDELYFNLIGTEWDTTISNFTFSITMPKDFDKSNIGFSFGSYGSTSSKNIHHTVDGNVITGSCDRVINNNEALTIRIELPEGYFVGASNAGEGIIAYLIFILPAIMVCISYSIWKKYGKDTQVIETVEFYPPEGFNSLELGYLFKGEVDSTDVLSLLIYLANKGYIKIVETAEKSLFSTKKGIKIIKLKEYDGSNINERLFLKGLFKNYSSHTDEESSDNDIEKSNNSDITEVDVMDLYDNFYITVDNILENMNNKENKNKIFESAGNGKTKYIIYMIIAIFCLITIPAIIQFGKIDFIVVGLLFPGFGFTLSFAVITGGKVYSNGTLNKSRFGSIAIACILGCVFGLIPWIFMVLPALLEAKIYLFGYLFGMVCVLIMTIFINHLPKRTPYGNQILGKILGFKNFLETAEKEQLEQQVMKNPQYFYNILPYTYVLSVSEKWINKFESIVSKAPEWYESDTAFNIDSFNTFINDTMSSASEVMASAAPSSSGSGGGFDSSGGGSSGSGSGGGGGGSW